MINALIFSICIYICVCRIFFLVRIILSRLQYRSNSASLKSEYRQYRQYFAIPFVPKWRINHEADCLHGWTLWTLLVGFSTNSGWQFDCERRSDPANLQRYLKLCSVPMKWNKLNWEIPLSLSLSLSISLLLWLYIEKQTAYSNIPIGCDIQTWDKVIQRNAGKLNLFEHSRSWVYME